MMQPITLSSPTLRPSPIAEGPVQKVYEKTVGASRMGGLTDMSNALAGHTRLLAELYNNQVNQQALLNELNAKVSQLLPQAPRFGRIIEIDTYQNTAAAVEQAAKQAVNGFPSALAERVENKVVVLSDDGHRSDYSEFHERLRQHESKNAILENMAQREETERLSFGAGFSLTQLTTMILNLLT